MFLMNTFTDAQLIVSRDVAALLDRVGARRRRTSTADEREALATLSEHGFIVDDREARAAAASSSSSATSARDTDQLRVTVLTTLQCNFACDYCFQGDHGDYNKFAAKMTMETADRRGALDGGAARHAEAGELRAHAVRRRAAAESAGGVLPGGAAVARVAGARRADAASTSSPTDCC